RRVVQAGADAWTGEGERRPRLHDVERAVLPGLKAEGVALRADDQVGGVGAVEELRDALVRVRVAELRRLDEGAVYVLGRVAGRRGRLQLLGAGGDGRVALIGDRIDADLLDDGEHRLTVAATTLEAHHAACRPDLVGALPAGDDEVDLIGDLSVAQQRED